MIFLPEATSISTPCAFIATSTPPLANPYSRRDSASIHGFGEKASNGTLTQKSSPNAVVTGALPRVLVALPEIGKAMIAPTAKSSSRVPSVSIPIPSF
jgi:hypothetical protein